MKIVNIGSLNYDKVYDLEHFVQEGETISALGYEESLGGKGLNQSVALARAGAEVYHAGAVGADGFALREYLEGAGVCTEYLQSLDTVSGHAIIQRSSGKNCIIVYGGANQCVTEDYIREVLGHFASDDILLLQNETSGVATAIRLAKERGMQVAFNASPVNETLLSYPLDQVDYFLINEVEGAYLSGIESQDFQEILQALARRFPNAAIILTLGEKGVLYRDPWETHTQAAYLVQAEDTTAAGDTFCGFCLAALARGKTVKEALLLATKASAIAVSRKGAAASIPTLEEVLAY